jgi:hypothetical protein
MLAMVVAAPASAQASCYLGDNGITYNRSGQGAKFKSVTPLNGMNCASARYVVNKWIRRKFSRSYNTNLPTKFYDGFVTWYCGRLTSRKWRCNEYSSNTSFTFVAYVL